MLRLNSRALLAALSIGLTLGACRSSDKDKLDSGITPSETGPASEGGPASETTIKDIVTRKIPEGTSVVLRDVIVTAVDGFGAYTGNVFVQDVKGGPSSGLELYRPQRIDDGQITDLVPGDHVKVEGTVQWFSPKTSPFGSDKLHPNKKNVVELAQGCQVSRLSSGTPPTPAVVTLKDVTTDPTAETWEWVLVTIKDVGVTKPVDAQYGEFEVGGALTVDDELFPHTPKVGDCMSVTGIMEYFYEYKIMPRAAEDIGAGQGCPVVQALTIKDVRDPGSAKHPQPGTAVTVTGVITAADTTPDSSQKYSGFWIEDPAGGPFSGIYVYYTWTAASALKPNVGDLVELTGEYTEYKASTSTRPDTLAEITGASWTVKGKGTVPTPALVQAAEIGDGGAKAREYQSVLVKMENVTVGDPAMTTGTSPKQVGFLVQGADLAVESVIFDFLGTALPKGGVYKSITGVAYYGFDTYMVLPRSAEDLVK